MGDMGVTTAVINPVSGGLADPSEEGPREMPAFDRSNFKYLLYSSTYLFQVTSLSYDDGNCVFCCSVSLFPFTNIKDTA